MTEAEESTLIKEMDLPFHRIVTLKDITFTGGMKALRMTFRERKRFTMIDLDSASATELANSLLAWAEENK